MRVIPDFIKDMILLGKLQKEGWRIMDIENPTERQQLAAVRNHVNYIVYIKEPTEKVQLAVVKEWPSLLQYIKNPTEKVQREVIKNNVSNIQFVAKPSEELQEEVIGRGAYNIRYIKNPSIKTQMAAVNENAYVITSIREPDAMVCLAAATKICKGDIGDINSDADIVGEAKKLFARLDVISNTAYEYRLNASYADSYEVRDSETKEADEWEERQNARAIQKFKNDVTVNKMLQRISDIEIYPSGDRNMSIRCRIDGVQQMAVNLSWRDAVEYNNWGDEKQLAADYFKDALNEKQELHSSIRR